MRILLIEDEIALAEALAEILKQNDYPTDTVNHGPDGLDYARSGIYDMIILDIMLPQMDGLTILRTLRTEGITTPVILLTARSEVTDVITGLDAGSDDYLTKPFSAEVLLARIRALTRRGRGYVGNILSFADLSLNKGTMELGCADRRIRLGLKEALLAELLLTNPGQIIPKALLLEKIWGLDSDAEYNNIEVYISFLRQKMQALDTTVYIRTVRGVGYKLEAGEHDQKA